MVIDEPMTSGWIVPPHGRARVLVVDDEETVTVTIQGILELDGHEATATTCTETALELIRSQTFDVLLTDLRLESFDGLDVLKVLHRVSPDAVAIVLTGYA